VRRALQVAAGLAISGSALWLTLRGEDLGAIWEATRAGDYRFLAPYLLILLAVHLVKTVRWGLLLRPVAEVPFERLNAVAAVGFMALMLLPFRLGELARPILISERPRLRTSAALASIVVERAADGLFTGLLLVIALLAVPDGTPRIRLLRAGGGIVTGAFAAVIAFLAFAYRNRAGAVGFARAALRPLSPRLAERGAGILDAFIHGLRVLPGRGSIAIFFGLTAVYWALVAASMAILAAGFGFSLGVSQACALVGILVVGVMIPAGPGMIGTFQGAIVLGLSLLAPAADVATRGTAYANVLWAGQLAQVTLVGLPFLFSRHVKVARLLGAASEVEEGLEDEEAEYRSAGDGAR
jgi:glycosyltransferase 2 family protein